MEESKDLMQQFLNEEDSEDEEAPFDDLEDLRFYVASLVGDSVETQPSVFAQVPPIQDVHDFCMLPEIQPTRSTKGSFSPSHISPKRNVYSYPQLQERIETVESVLLQRIVQLEEMYFHLLTQLDKVKKT